MGINLEDYGWSRVPAVEPGEFISLPAGAYVCKIVDARIDSVKNTGLLLTLDVDVVEGEYAGIFEKRRTDKGRDFNAQFVRYVIKRTDEGNVVQSQVKGLIKMLEEQNPNFKFNFTNFDEKSLCGLTCGFIFGEREYLTKTNEIKTTVSLKFPVRVADVRSGNFKMPPLQKLPPDKRPPEKHPDKQNDNSKFDGTPVDDNDLPF